MSLEIMPSFASKLALFKLAAIATLRLNVGQLVLDDGMRFNEANEALFIFVKTHGLFHILRPVMLLGVAFAKDTQACAYLPL